MSTELEDKIVDYIKQNSSDGRSLDMSLAKMTEHIGCSVASVHRNVQRLESQGLIRVDKRRAKNKPDIITFLGNDTQNVLSVVSKLMDQSASFTLLISDLSSKIQSQQDEIQALRNRVREYERRTIIDQVKISDEVTAIFYRN